MNISLVPVDVENWEEFIELDVKPHQQGMVMSPVKTLAMSAIYDDVTVKMICLDDSPCGIAAYFKDEQGDYYIDQFFIDRRFQGKSIGQESMRLLISEIQSQPDYTSSLKIGLLDNNNAAAEFYKKIGFMDKGETKENLKWGFVEKVFSFE